MTNYHDIGKRLESFRIELKLSQVALSQLLDVSQSYYSEIIFGRKGISAKVIINITLAFKNLNIRWLLTGEGEMFNFPNYFPPPELDSGISDKLEEGVKIEYASPEGQMEGIQRRLEDHEQRLRDLERRT